MTLLTRHETCVYNLSQYAAKEGERLMFVKDHSIMYMMMCVMRGSPFDKAA